MCARACEAHDHNKKKHEIRWFPRSPGGGGGTYGNVVQMMLSPQKLYNLHADLERGIKSYLFGCSQPWDKTTKTLCINLMRPKM